MSKFKVEFSVNSHDTDQNGNLYPSVAQRYIHEAANLQLENSHPTMDELRYEQKKAFLLSRVSMALTRPLRKMENVTATTWAAGGKAASFYRCGELTVGDEVVGKLFSVWALLDLETLRLCRVRDTELGLDIVEEYPLEAPSHIRFPKELVWEEMGKRRIFNSDIDLNGHMNNTNYPNMMCDFIPNIENSFVTAFSIGYLHEAKLGEELTVYHASEEDTHYIRTVRSDGSENAQGVFVLEAVV